MTLVLLPVAAQAQSWEYEVLAKGAVSIADFASGRSSDMEDLSAQGRYYWAAGWASGRDCDTAQAVSFDIMLSRVPDWEMHLLLDAVRQPDGTFAPASPTLYVNTAPYTSAEVEYFGENTTQFSVAKLTCVGDGMFAYDLHMTGTATEPDGAVATVVARFTGDFVLD